MSEGQETNYRDQSRGDIYRLPVGLFRCPEGLSGSETDCEWDALWEHPLELYLGGGELSWPRCPICGRRALLVEVVRHGVYLDCFQDEAALAREGLARLLNLSAEERESIEGLTLVEAIQLDLIPPERIEEAIRRWRGIS